MWIKYTGVGTETGTGTGTGTETGTETGTVVNTTMVIVISTFLDIYRISKWGRLLLSQLGYFECIEWDLFECILMSNYYLAKHE